MRRIPLHRALSSAAAISLFGAAVGLAFVSTSGIAAAEAPREAEGVPAGWVPYDGGELLEPTTLSGSTPLELAIDLFTSGSPAVKWRTDNNPLVTLCSAQQNRPAGVTAEEFRDAITLGVEVWSHAESAIGIEYVGDCASTSWSENNGRNEIGWDDGRNVVRSPAAGVTFGRWADRFFSRDFQETDIVLDHELSVPRACLNSVVAHELGHALGLGHSDVVGDLMYRSFDPGNPATCPGRPTASEVNVLRSLYGLNRAPSIDGSQLDHAVGAGTRASVTVTATDPEGDDITYTWTQTSGTSVAFNVSGGTILFDAPADRGVMLRFRVTARDEYLHAASAEVVVRVIDADAPPAEAPYLEGLRVSSDGDRLALKFTEVAGATTYRYCATPTAFSMPSCQTVPSPQGEITWDTVLTTAAPEGETLRVVTTGLRDVKVQACNEEGCVQDDATQILAGGLRWAAHRVDYDYFAMTQDIGSSRFTIGLVQNMTGTAREFSLYSGTEEDPTRTLMLQCGRMMPGDVCVGFLAPGDRGHGTHVTIRSEGTRTAPAIENRVRVR